MRLDQFLFNSGRYNSRNKAAEAIKRGEISVNGAIERKPSYLTKEGDDITVSQLQKPFVSLGGYKLQKAIEMLNPPIEGRVFIDVGASTGGFTDCLLRRKARKVYCVDVGEGQLDKSLKENSAVVVMDNTNARYLTKELFDEPIEGIVVDCSFISLEYLLKPISELLDEQGYLLALIKPQFELEQRIKLKNGILRNDKQLNSILKRLYEFSIQIDLKPQAMVNVTDDCRKNNEFIFYLKKSGNARLFAEMFFNDENWINK